MFSTEFITSLVEMPFSAVISANVLGIMKQDLKSIGFRSFPAFTLTGVPGSGKTAISRACLYDKNLEYNFHYRGRVAEVQNKIFEVDDRAVLLDDFAQFRSIYQRDKAARYIDSVVRDSFNGDGGILIITAEDAALDAISPACIDRMFLLPVVKIWDNPSFKNILNFLQNSCDLQMFIDTFKKWYLEQNNLKEDIMALLTQYRNNSSNDSMRTKNLVFAYHIAMKFICRYLQEKHNLPLPQDKIERNCEYLFELRKNHSEIENNLLKILLSKVFEKELITVYKPYLYEACERYCRMNCNKAVNACFRKPNYCRRDIPENFIECYLPQDILLPDEVNSALLIEQPSSIFQFPRHIDNLPILIIRDNILLSLINSELEKYCMEKKLHIQRYSLKKLHKSLFEQNLCLYRCIGKNHICYNFDYLNHSLQTESVVFLRLPKNKSTSINAEYLSALDTYINDCRNISEILSMWKKVFGNMYAQAGAIGESEEII